jgi:AMP-binding enzyme
MKLGDPGAPAQAQQPTQRGIAIDEILRRIAQRRPDSLALIDAPNRESFTDGAPRRLSYAQAERVVEAIAGRLRGMGLPADAVIGIQLPNVAENILTILGVLRAGMIAAPMPLLWRRADAVTALGRIGPKALITCGRVGAFNHCQLAMRVASELFSIRYICGFGNKLPDGVVAFDDLFAAEAAGAVLPAARDGQADAASHVAFITFDVEDNGIVPVARNHLEALAAGVAVTLESRFAQNARILSTLAPASFASLSLTLMPWLLSSGTLSLHYPFDAATLGRQIRSDGCTTLILPGAVALRFAEAGVFSEGTVATVIGGWRAPERLETSGVWRERQSAFVDVAIFGEAGLVVGRRGDDGRPAAISSGPITAPRNASGATTVAEVAVTTAGTVALRGPMVPRHPYPPGIAHSGLPHFKIESSGLVDTGYPCRADAATRTITVTGGPPGLVGIGGYRFPLHELQEAAARIDGAATLAALPDPVLGQRLIGKAAQREMVEAALAAVGANPLVTAAFGERAEAGDAAGTAAPA